MDQEKIGLLFKERREAKNITQQELADILNVTDRAISNWEHGRRLPDYSLLAKLCDILSISLEEVFLMGKKKEDKKQSIKEINEMIDYYFQNHTINEKTGLNNEYNMSKYVIGECNATAFLRCDDVINDLGGKYNPFYVYGNKGTGKTHLVQAFGLHLKTHFRSKVLYVTSYQFMDDCYNLSIGELKIQSFLDKYQKNDVLIIDDIQKIRGDRAILELFHIIDYLLEHHKQLIFTGDSNFNGLKLDDQIKERLHRVYLGPLYEIDLETKEKILLKILSDFPKIEVKKTAIKYFITKADNVTELKEEVGQLIAYALIQNVRLIRLKEAREALLDTTDQDLRSFYLEKEHKEFSEQYNKDNKYYIDTHNKSLHKLNTKTKEWYELVVNHHDNKLTNTWMKNTTVEGRKLKLIPNFQKVIDYANQQLEDIKNGIEESNIDIDDLTSED